MYATSRAKTKYQKLSYILIFCLVVFLHLVLYPHLAFRPRRRGISIAKLKLQFQSMVNRVRAG